MKNAFTELAETCKACTESIKRLSETVNRLKQNRKLKKEHPFKKYMI